MVETRGWHGGGPWLISDTGGGTRDKVGLGTAPCRVRPVPSAPPPRHRPRSRGGAKSGCGRGLGWLWAGLTPRWAWPRPGARPWCSTCVPTPPPQAPPSPSPSPKEPLSLGAASALIAVRPHRPRPSPYNRRGPPRALPPSPATPRWAPAPSTQGRRGVTPTPPTPISCRAGDLGPVSLRSATPLQKGGAGGPRRSPARLAPAQEQQQQQHPQSHGRWGARGSPTGSCRLLAAAALPALVAVAVEIGP